MINLRSYEAAARHCNFTRAAAELNVSQPAVSRHIRNLESRLSVCLFRRKGNVIELTSAGARLYEAVHGSLEHISTIVSEICEERFDGPISIRSDATMFRNFIIPAGTQKKAKELGLSLEFVTVPNHESFHTEEPTIAVAYGVGRWSGYHSERIFDDALFPVCAPKLIGKVTATKVNNALKSRPLLQYTGFLDEWQDWRQWVDRLGMEEVTEKRLQHFNDYEMLLQACRAGDGIAVGSLCLVAPSLCDGTLLRLTDKTVWTRYGYYLVFDPILLEDKRVLGLIDFFKDAAVRISQQFSLDAGVAGVKKSAIR